MRQTYEIIQRHQHYIKASQSTLLLNKDASSLNRRSTNRVAAAMCRSPKQKRKHRNPSKAPDNHLIPDTIPPPQRKHSSPITSKNPIPQQSKTQILPLPEARIYIVGWKKEAFARALNIKRDKVAETEDGLCAELR